MAVFGHLEGNNIRSCCLGLKQVYIRVVFSCFGLSPSLAEEMSVQALRPIWSGHLTRERGGWGGLNVRGVANNLPKVEMQKEIS